MNPLLKLLVSEAPSDFVLNFMLTKTRIYLYLPNGQRHQLAFTISRLVVSLLYSLSLMHFLILFSDDWCNFLYINVYLCVCQCYSLLDIQIQTGCNLIGKLYISPNRIRIFSDNTDSCLEVWHVYWIRVGISFAIQISWHKYSEIVLHILTAVLQYCVPVVVMSLIFTKTPCSSAVNRYWSVTFLFPFECAKSLVSLNPFSMKFRRVYWLHLIHLSAHLFVIESWLFYIFYNTSHIYFKCTHLINPLKKVCHILCYIII